MSRDVEIWKSLYRTFIRPQLEFAVSSWNPFLKRDISTIEKVQRRVTRLPTPLKGLSYEERCERMKLTTLEERRRRGDLIQLYKIRKETDNVNWVCKPVWSISRGPKREQLRREIVSSCQTRHNFFLNRIENSWNALSNDIVESDTVELFKKRLDEHMSRRLL